MFNDEDDQMYDEFGNPIYRSEMGPTEPPENYDALKLLSSINNRPQSLPLLQTLGKPAITSTPDQIQPKSDLENKLSKYKETVSVAGGPSQAKSVLPQNDLLEQNKTIDFGDVKSIASLDKLKELQGQIKANLNSNDMASGFNMIASAFSPKVVERLDKKLAQERSEADRPLKDYEQQIAMEKKDPNSPFSKGFRDYVKTAFGYDIKGDVSAADLEGTFLKPMLTQYEGAEKRKSLEYTAEQNRIATQANLASKSADRMAYLKSQDDYRRDDAKRKSDNYQENKIKNYTDKALGSPEFKKAQESIVAIDRLKELAKDAVTNGGQSLAQLGPQVARGLAGEVGAMTDKDVTMYVVDPSVAGRMRDLLVRAKSGKLSDVSYDNLMRMTDIMEKKARDVRNKVYSDYATRLSRNSKDLSFEDAYKKINPEYLDGDPVPGQNKSEDTVRVVDQNGNIGTIPRKNLQKALDRGAKEVK